jgi:hypothetical protein
MKWSDYSKLSKAERKAVPFKEIPMGQKIAVFTFIAILIAMIVFAAKSCNSDKKTDYDSVKITAMSLSKQHVKSLLKSPSTANFPLGEEKITLSEDSMALVEGPVDSQNGFGATVRTNYKVLLKWKLDPEDPANWELKDIRMNE